MNVNALYMAKISASRTRLRPAKTQAERGERRMSFRFWLTIPANSDGRLSVYAFIVIIVYGRLGATATIR